MFYDTKDYSKNLNFKEFVLAVDAGGTNTNLGILGMADVPELIFSTHFKTANLKHVSEAINETLKYAKEKYNIEVTRASVAVAGVLSPDRKSARLTNVDMEIKQDDVLAKTMLKSVLIMNDFDAIGYAINVIKPAQLHVLSKKEPLPNSIIAVVGAGTGLGKTHIEFNGKKYVPRWSEGGHCDFPASDEFEFEMMQFIKDSKRITGELSWEDVISGQGIANIYHFIRQKKLFPVTRYTREIDRNPASEIPKLISEYSAQDQTCRKTLKIFVNQYARCARNFCLDVLPFGGLYLAGGIAPKHLDLFEELFMLEFTKNYGMSEVLRRIPVYVITDYNVSLVGAAYALI